MTWNVAGTVAPPLNIAWYAAALASAVSRRSARRRARTALLSPSTRRCATTSTTAGAARNASAESPSTAAPTTHLSVVLHRQRVRVHRRQREAGAAEQVACVAHLGERRAARAEAALALLLAHGARDAHLVQRAADDSAVRRVRSRRAAHEPATVAAPAQQRGQEQAVGPQRAPGRSFSQCRPRQETTRSKVPGASGASSSAHTNSRSTPGAAGTAAAASSCACESSMWTSLRTPARPPASRLRTSTCQRCHTLSTALTA
jgi:hypothetical protein